MHFEIRNRRTTEPLRKSNAVPNQRPWLMVLGNPVCQPCCAFHGRSERFSGSVVLQAVKTSAIAAQSKRSRSAFILVEDLIAFFDVSQLPAGNDVGHTTIRKNFADADFADQLAVAMNH